MLIYDRKRKPKLRRGATHTPLLVAISSGMLVFAGTFLLSKSADSYSYSSSSLALESDPVVAIRRQEPIQTVNPFSGLDPEIVLLGEKLFHEPRLSPNSTVSCASCHDLKQGGVDRLTASIGIHGQVGSVNAPTVFNVALNYKHFWDGRANSLEEQVDGPITNPMEMGSSWQHIIAFLNEDSQYRRRFKEVFKSAASPELVRRAIADFERSLTTPNSRFDKWLIGDDAALSDSEKRGYELFKEYRCISCHQGANVGGNSFQRLGVMSEYFTGDRIPSAADNGRFNVTGEEEDRHVFRVPPLRNIELTAPYFHDGSAQTLAEAVAVMIEFQLGRAVVQKDVEDISAFLKSLTGEYRKGGLQ